MELFLKVFIIMGLLEIASSMYYLGTGELPARSKNSMAFNVAVVSVFTVWALGIFIGSVT